MPLIQKVTTLSGLQLIASFKHQSVWVLFYSWFGKKGFINEKKKVSGETRTLYFTQQSRLLPTLATPPNYIKISPMNRTSLKSHQNGH
jgi:hypothetical protein